MHKGVMSQLHVKYKINFIKRNGGQETFNSLTCNLFACKCLQIEKCYLTWNFYHFFYCKTDEKGEVVAKEFIQGFAEYAYLLGQEILVEPYAVCCSAAKLLKKFKKIIKYADDTKEIKHKLVGHFVCWFLPAILYRMKEKYVVLLKKIDDDMYTKVLTSLVHPILTQNAQLKIEIDL